MGLDDADPLDDGDGEGSKASSVSCSICLEAVSYRGDRSRAKLHCGHEFHLDCIGSAFNIKGAMQCPNCRKIEKGQWLYANSCRPFSEFNVDEWPHDEDLYDLGYSEMSLGVHWCPFSGLTRLSPSFDEGDFSSTAYHEYLAQQAVYTEHSTIPSSGHPCPYITYFGPVHHPSSSNSNGNVSDGSNVNIHWNGPSVPSEVHTSFAFPAMDVHYQSWEHHSPAFPSSHMGASNQPSISSVSHRAARGNSDVSRSGSFLHPFVIGHGSAARPGSSVAASIIPPYPGSVARARDRVQALQAYFQQNSNSPAIRAPVISVTRRSSNHRGLAQVGPVATSTDQANGFFVFPPASSGGNFHEAENSINNRFHTWDREQLHLFPLNQVNRDPGWGPFHHGPGGSETGIRPSGMRPPRQGSERTPSHNRS